METKPGKQRRRFSKDERQQLVAAWHKSGLSADAFSHQVGLCRSNLWRWSRAATDNGSARGRVAGRRVQNTAATPFVELQVSRAARTEQPATSARTASAHAPAFEIEGPFGFRVRIYAGADSETLRQLFELLPGAARC
jgi:transposase-like protein